MELSTPVHVHARRVFYHRFLVGVLLAAGLVAASLVVGIAGYHFIAGLGWIDSLLNSSMILSGMGPVSELRSNGAKVFASCYALFSGLVFVTASGIILSPVFHRALYRFHIEEKRER